MESPRKFNDCYFYYYSTCTKGDNCVFRHEPSALGCETMCAAWQQGKCLDKRCKLRHMELRKNRKQIPCYWENQPGGCRKKHCPFQHKNPEARTDGIAPSQPILAGQGPPMPVGLEGGEQTMIAPPPAPTAGPPPPLVLPHELLWQQQQRQVVLDSAILGVLPASSDLLQGRRVLAPPPHEQQPNPYAPMPVDPLVVNFEEESDNESAPSSTPTKMISPEESFKSSRLKSLELMQLERIQAEAAAYYFYDRSISIQPEPLEPRPVRTNLTSKYDQMSLDEITGRKQNIQETQNSFLDFKILSLDEIRARKKQKQTSMEQPAFNVSSRKRKLPTGEIAGLPAKVIKVVSQNSIVFKQVNGIPVTEALDQNSSDVRLDLSSELRCRKRKVTDDCNNFVDAKRDLDTKVDATISAAKLRKTKITSKASKPKLIRSRPRNISRVKGEEDIKIVNNLGPTVDVDTQSNVVFSLSNDTDNKSVERQVESKLQHTTAVVTNDITEHSDSKNEFTTEIAEIIEETNEANNLVSPKNIVCLGTHNVPDVVASCQGTISVDRVNIEERDVLNEIDAILCEDSL